METLDLRLLGGFELRRADGEAVVVSSRKSAALIAFLALQPGRPQSREKLAGLLWGDRPDAHARASLRQALLNIRQMLPDRPFISEPRPDWLALDDRGVAIDTEAFEDAIGRGGFSDLDQAVRLFRGDFLEGIRVRSEPFETWLMGERQRLRSEVMSAMQMLLEAKLPAPADKQIQIACKVLMLDPAQESAHRTLMRLYAASGQRSEALRQYFRCRETLWREFSVLPEPATDLLYKAVLARTEPAAVVVRKLAG